jgi:uncharacterized protein
LDGGRLPSLINLLGPWLRARLGEPCAKIGLDSGLGCPTRDAAGLGGCSFCPPSASGRGLSHLSIGEQLDLGWRGLVERAGRKGRRPPLPLAYFQAASNTNAPPQTLRALWEQALAFPGLAGLIISTRPDCLSPAIWDLLSEMNRRAFFWLELGLQSAHDPTLRAIGRGHDLACFDAAVAQARARGIMVVAHVILGLPGETRELTCATARHLADLGVWGVKMHSLMVLEGAALAEDFRAGSFTPWDLPQWVEAAAEFLGLLPPETVIHRLAADPGGDRLLAPDWAGRKNLALTALAGYMMEHGLRQGGLRA